MTTVSERDEIAQALDALRGSAAHQTEISCLGSEIRRAASAGASWHQIVEAIGVDRTEAWEQLRQDVGSAIERNALSSEALSEAEAMEIAVAEVKAVRAERAQRKTRPRRRSGLSI